MKEKETVEVKPNDIPLLVPDFSGKMSCPILEEEAKKTFEILQELMKTNFHSRPVEK